MNKECMNCLRHCYWVLVDGEIKNYAYTKEKAELLAQEQRDDGAAGVEILDKDKITKNEFYGWFYQEASDNDDHYMRGSDCEHCNHDSDTDLEPEEERIYEQSIYEENVEKYERKKRKMEHTEKKDV